MSERGDIFPIQYPDDTSPRHAPLSLDWRTPVADEPMWTSDQRLYLDINGRLVDEGDPAMQTLLVDAGHAIPLAQAQALGLVTAEPDEEAHADAAKPHARRIRK